MKLLSFMLVALAVTSCQDDVVDIDELRDESVTNRVSTAEPTITGVYDYDAFMASDTPSPCVEAEMGQYLVVSGENLEGLTSLLFHGLDIESSQYYAQWDMIVMSVPHKLPESNASGVVICTTELGSTEYSIDLRIPNIEIVGISNEFVMQGNSVDIIGEYLSLCEFDSDDSMIYLESADGAYKEQVEITEITDNAVTIVIPENAPDNAYITFVMSGATQTQRLHYRPTDLLLVANNDLVIDVKSASATLHTLVEDDIPNIFADGYASYLRVVGSSLATGVLNAVNTTYEFEFEDGKSASDYTLAYEIISKDGCAIPAGTYKFMVNDKGVDMWENLSTVSIDTKGEWVTQRINLASVCTNLKASGESNKYNIKAIKAIPTEVDHAFANFRIEPIIK